MGPIFKIKKIKFVRNVVRLLNIVQSVRMKMNVSYV